MKITQEELEDIITEVVSSVYAIGERVPTELRPADRLYRKKLRQLDPDDPDYPSTVGELKHLLRVIKSSKRADDLVKALPGQLASLVGLGGLSAVKSFYNIYKTPDEEKTDTDLDKLNIDDEISKIVDDTVEDNFINHLIKTLKGSKFKDDDPIPDVDEMLRQYLMKNYDKRTVTGYPRKPMNEEPTSNTGESIMKITKQELADIIREELTQIDFDAPPSEEEKRMGNLTGMIESEAMAKMDTVISMISKHLITTRGFIDDKRLLNEAMGMLKELGFEGLDEEKAEELISDRNLAPDSDDLYVPLDGHAPGDEE